MSTQVPKLEKLANASLLSLAATVMAEAARAGEEKCVANTVPNDAFARVPDPTQLEPDAPAKPVELDSRRGPAQNHFARHLADQPACVSGERHPRFEFD